MSGPAGVLASIWKGAYDSMIYIPRRRLFIPTPYLSPTSAVTQAGGRTNGRIGLPHQQQCLSSPSPSAASHSLVRYHGYRVPGDKLWDSLQAGRMVDKDPFLAALTSAVDHLRNVVGLVHNDIHPGNIMVNPSGEPTLIDLGAAYPEGEGMTEGIPY
ncbi:uncharacterized protein B0T15DRAFT_234738 [Chaetomium strumarium]|uniref:Protein kinase domain-containing protein n=1 Tax=Chaetomium strumarium TaxID=1170767 RepID=A0AAJ0GQI3_9PEZI|nr:hypothetical protein B0T15DRAFT_234738 [Chaetomium strumarium]